MPQKKVFSAGYAGRNAVDLGISKARYLRTTRTRFVILIAGAFPHVWGDRSPVLFPTREAAQKEAEHGDRLITEKEFLNNYCI